MTPIRPADESDPEVKSVTDSGAAAETPPGAWKIPKRRIYPEGDSRHNLMKLGFVISPLEGGLYYYAFPPLGLKAETSSSWTEVWDNTGKHIMSIFVLEQIRFGTVANVHFFS